MASRVWTLEDANMALPRVRAALVQARGVLADFVLANKSGNRDGADAARSRLKDILEPMLKENIMIKDLERGLVDFPSQLGSQVVMLCYVDGEECVSHFHTMEAGFAGRKPIPKFENLVTR